MQKVLQVQQETLAVLVQEDNLEPWVSLERLVPEATMEPLEMQEVKDHKDLKVLWAQQALEANKDSLDRQDKQETLVLLDL